MLLSNSSTSYGAADGAARAAPRPFRSPHSSASTTGILGGGGGVSVLRTRGEATLAHCGVLFLDDLPDFGRGAAGAWRRRGDSLQQIADRPSW
ncbi:MAG TPA: ATP-binding protein [Thermoanaerobaculia bacterium]|nr:ATP-binding protein [Thermoanaerobaculia bacterium]